MVRTAARPSPDRKSSERALQADVLVVHGFRMDAVGGWGDPARELARRNDLPHQGADVLLVVVGGEPLVDVRLPRRTRRRGAVRADVVIAERANGAVEPDVRQAQLEADVGSVRFQRSTPLRQSAR